MLFPTMLAGSSSQPDGPMIAGTRLAAASPLKVDERPHDR